MKSGDERRFMIPESVLLVLKEFPLSYTGAREKRPEESDSTPQLELFRSMLRMNASTTNMSQKRSFVFGIEASSGMRWMDVRTSARTTPEPVDALSTNPVSSSDREFFRSWHSTRRDPSGTKSRHARTTLPSRMPSTVSWTGIPSPSYMCDPRNSDMGAVV